eukprot:scaffold13576_cov125-Isochrysis_galbana.AAC.5
MLDSRGAGRIPTRLFRLEQDSANAVDLGRRLAGANNLESVRGRWVRDLGRSTTPRRPPKESPRPQYCY